MGEAEESECIRTPFATLPSSESRQSAKLDQPCLPLVERQAKLRQSFLEVRHHLPRVRRFLKAHHTVVGIPNDRHATPGLSATLLMDPEIKGIVQHDVGEERTYTRSLRRSLIHFAPFSALQDSRLEPHPDEPEDPWVGNPMRHHPHQLFVIDEAANVGIEHPIHVLAHDRCTPRR